MALVDSVLFNEKAWKINKFALFYYIKEKKQGLSASQRRLHSWSLVKKVSPYRQVINSPLYLRRESQM